MKCQFCDNPATVHLTDIVNKKKREVHLCEGCARGHNLLPDPPAPAIDLKALLSLLAPPAALTCPSCGIKYGEFRAEGRLGCPDDYAAFRTVLEPLLERVHRAVAHAGKVPRGFRRQAAKAELRELKKRMAVAAKAEDYEEAARLRDLIRRKEGSDEPG